MAKRIPVLNCPFGRTHERISDCLRFIKSGDAILQDGGLEYTEQFLEYVRRMRVESDPSGANDGIVRRWTNAASGKASPGLAAVNGQLLGDGKLIVVSPGGISAKQLLPVKKVGTGKFVSKRPDPLRRRSPGGLW